MLLQLPDVRIDVQSSPFAKLSPSGITDPDMWAIPEALRKAMKRNGNREGDLDAFMSSLLCNSILGLWLGIAFCVLSRRYPRVYCDNAGKSYRTKVGSETGEIAKILEPPEGWLGWISRSWYFPAEDVEGIAGLDGAMFIEFQDLALRLLVRIGIPVVSMCPLHFFLGGNVEHLDKLSQLGMNHIADLIDHQWLYWVHAGLVWWVCIVTVRELFRAQEKFVAKRYAWLSHMPRPRSTTILVESIPDEYCDDKKLKEYFQSLHLFTADKIEDVHVVRRTYKLMCAVDEYNSYKQSLEDAKEEKIEPKSREECPCLTSGMTIDEIQKELEKSAKKVKAAREKAQGHTCNAFVTFKDELDAALALCLKVQGDEYIFMMSTPPHPADIIYGDLFNDPHAVWVQSLLGHACLLGLFFGFVPIILAISSIINLTILERHFPFIKDVLALHPSLPPLAEGVVASAALTMFMSFLPTIMMIIFNSFFYLKAGQWAQQRLQMWYFWFQVIFILLITAVGSSLWDTAMELVNHPTMIFELLAFRLPSSTHFYLNFMGFQCIVHVLNLCRYMNLVKFKAFYTVFSEDRAKELSEPEDQDYYGIGARSARHTINLVIAIVYCSLCPLITVLTGINFLIGRVVYSYLIVFAETRKPDLGGHFWVQSLRHIQHGLLLYVTLMIGVLSNRALSFGPTVVVAPALVYVVGSYFRFHSAFNWEYMPYGELSKRLLEKKQIIAWETLEANAYKQKELFDPPDSELDSWSAPEVT